MSRAAVLVASLVLLSIANTIGQQSAAPVPWPPGVQAVGEQSPPLSPAQALRTFHMPPSYRLELVAGEPLVQDPVAIDWDPQGRLWVVEMPGYMADIAATGEHDPVGRVVVLVDSNRDGRLDRRTVFADGLVLARSVKALEHGLLVGEPPNVWLMRDTDGDLRADTKSLVTDKFGRREIDVQNNANGFDWSLDNRLRTAGQSQLHLQWKAGTLVTGSSLARGQWGVTHDDAGRTYRNSNESALHVDLVASEYFARNPALLRTRGSYERLASVENALNDVWPVRPTPGLNRGYQSGIRRDDGTLARHTAVCSPLVFRGDALPAEMQGNVFVADPAANLVSRITLHDDGTTLRADKGYLGAEFLASTDERFRPVFLANAPDGTLHIVDMYRGLIEHRLSLTVYLKEYAEKRGLVDPRGLGRIWRVVHDDVTPRPATMPTATTQDLVTLLSHANGWWRDTAQRLIVERGDTLAASALEALSVQAPDARTRAHALSALDGLEAQKPAVVERALGDGSPIVRSAAVRLSERWLGEPDHPLRSAIVARASDEDRHVRLQAVASLGVLPDGEDKWQLMAEVLRKRGDDPIVVDVVASGIRSAESRVLERLTTGALADPTPAAAAATLLAATIFRAGRDAEAQRWLAEIARPSSPGWQRDALMHGAEIGILGAPMTGLQAPLPTAPGVVCPTCAGGRLSTGGAYAYAWPTASTRPAGPGAALKLTRAPEAFVRLAADGSRLGKQAASVLTHVSWPGKPGDATTPPALTAAEQERFDTGRRI